MKKLFKMKTILIKVLMVVLLGVGGYCSLSAAEILGRQKSLVQVSSGNNGNFDCLRFKLCEGDTLIHNINLPDVILSISTKLNFSVGVPGVDLPNMHVYIYLQNIGFDSPVFLSDPIPFANFDSDSTGYTITSSDYSISGLSIDMFDYLENLHCESVVSFGLVMVANIEGTYIQYKDLHPQLFQGVVDNTPYLLSTCGSEGAEDQFWSYSSIHINNFTKPNKYLASGAREKLVEKNDIGDILAYPNPFNEIIGIKLNSHAPAVVLLEISNIHYNWEQKIRFKLERGENTLILDKIPNQYDGLFIIRIRGDNFIKSLKVIKNKTK